MMRTVSIRLFWTAAILACFCCGKTAGATLPCDNNGQPDQTTTTITPSTMTSTTMTSSTTSSTTVTSSTTPSTTMTSSTTPPTTMTSSTTPSTTTMTSTSVPSTTPPSTTVPSTTTWSTTTWSTTYWPTWFSSSTFPSTTLSSTTGPCATTSTPTASGQNGRPRFSTLQGVYPTYAKYPADAQKLKQDMGLPDWLFANGRPNTCAIRMSKTFHDAGLGINRGRVGACATKSARVNGNGRQYIIRALFFQCYLRAIWGQPDVTGIKSADDINCQKGIIIFTGCKGFGQHIDLWDGSSCSMGCNYFDVCSSIELYTLP